MPGRLTTLRAEVPNVPGGGAVKRACILRQMTAAVEGPFQLLGIADLIATVNAKASRYIQESAHKELGLSAVGRS